MKFRNPANDYVEELSAPWLWCLLFGGFYFIVKGVWAHALISFLLSIVTVGLIWFVYPFFANGIMKKHFLIKGWVEVRI